MHFLPALVSLLAVANGLQETPTVEQQEPTQAEVLEYLREAASAKPGPLTGSVGTMAEIAVPEELHYSDGDGARKLLEATGNLPDPSVLAAVLSLREDAQWFVLFSFDDSGYVKDEEKDELDADALMEALRDGTQQGNEVRKQRGLETLELVGWEREPFYDPKTNNLTWATRIRSAAGGESVNWEVRLLGRHGVMNVALVIAPEDLQAALPLFDTLIAGHAYKDGHRYAEFRSGDKVAEYGLGALVLGGAGFAAVKLGWFQKVWKFLLVGLLAAGAALKNLWGKFFGRRERGPEEPPPLQG